MNYIAKALIWHLLILAKLCIPCVSPCVSLVCSGKILPSHHPRLSWRRTTQLEAGLGIHASVQNLGPGHRLGANTKVGPCNFNENYI